jgi:hypothetical protein
MTEQNSDVDVDVDAALNSLLAVALAKANATSSLDDIGKAAAVAKALSEAQKAKVESNNSRAQLRLEWRKTLATLLVPLVSLLTVIFTIYVQYLQLDETHRQNESIQWREFLASVKTSSAAIQSDPTFAPRLRSFFSSPAVGEQAVEVSKRMMGGIANFPGFKDLFNVTFGEVASYSINDVVEVGRMLRANIRLNDDTCQSFYENLDDAKQKSLKLDLKSHFCAQEVTEKTIRQAGLTLDESTKLSELKQITRNLLDQNLFLSDMIAKWIRANFPVGSRPSPATISLKGLRLEDVDLSNVDFSSFDLSEVVFDWVTLDHAKLTPGAFGDSLEIEESKWWGAAEIDQKLLNDLLQSQYPYHTTGGDYPDGDVDEATYRTRISVLCKPMRPACDPSKLLFGSKKPLQ